MKRFNIRTSSQADFDIENLHFYILEICKSPLTSKQYIKGIYSEISNLSISAESFSVSELKVVLKYGHNARRINYKKMAIIYTIHEDIVLIHRVVPASMLIE
ncbi:hypothetical protein JZU68_03245 [bacterium]|jgi:hypothetical protein|nr:hypothetical protein [bacterium]